MERLQNIVELLGLQAFVEKLAVGGGGGGRYVPAPAFAQYSWKLGGGGGGRYVPAPAFARYSWKLGSTIDCC